MTNGYKHHHHHNQNIHHTTTNFLPLLCRASTQDIKVVALPNFSGDPSSPRVSCIGHVKRSNKVTGFSTPPPKPTTTAAAATTPSGRRPIHNSSYSTHRAGPSHQPRFNKSKSASRTLLTTITAAAAAPTTTTRPGGCASASGPILNSNYSVFKAGSIHKKPSNKPNPGSRTPIAAATPGSHAPARGVILNCNYSTLNACPVPRTTFEKSPAGPLMPLNTTAAAEGKSNVNYSKLKRLLFSGKNLVGPTTGNSCRSREMKMVNCRRRPEFRDESHRNYDVELDRPLPVVKKVKEPGFDREEVNLWKRRSSTSGFALKSLKIQQIHVGNNNHFHTPTTV